VETGDERWCSTVGESGPPAPAPAPPAALHFPAGGGCAKRDPSGRPVVRATTRADDTSIYPSCIQTHGAAHVLFRPSLLFTPCAHLSSSRKSLPSWLIDRPATCQERSCSPQPAIPAFEARRDVITASGFARSIRIRLRLHLAPFPNNCTTLHAIVVAVGLVQGLGSEIIR
jgi:hypothetical protein